jgi:hypothetical protein
LDRRKELIVLPMFDGLTAGAGREGQVSPKEGVTMLFHQHRNSHPGFQPGF